MFKPPIHYLEKISILLLTLYYSIFFINLVIDDGISWTLNFAFLGLFLLIFLSQKKVHLNTYLILTLLVPFVSIFLVDHFFHSSQTSEDKHFDLILAPQINNHYLFALSFLVLPSILIFLKKSELIFENTLHFTLIISLIFNGYFNFTYGFDRGLLITKFDAIILYDATIAALSILVLILNFKNNHKFAQLFIVLALINLFLIVGHGSRGTWLGIPFVLLLISFYYFKTHKSKVLLSLVSTLILSLCLLVLPNSPVHNRLNDFKQDTTSIEQKSYHSSTGNRLFLWKFSIEQFQSSPLIGVGTKAFRDSICDQQKLGVIPACNPHAHNLFFQFIATHGIFGLIGILFCFLAPSLFYLKSLWRQTNPIIQNYAMMGICFTGFYAICGLTDFLFFTAFPTMLYFLITVTLMTFIRKITTQMIDI